MLCQTKQMKESRIQVRHHSIKREVFAKIAEDNAAGAFKLNNSATSALINNDSSDCSKKLKKSIKSLVASSKQ